jgi:hypothetical protein
MPGFTPGIHVFNSQNQGLYVQDKPGQPKICLHGALARQVVSRGNVALVGTGRQRRRHRQSHGARPGSRVIRLLDSERDLAAFRALWAGLVETDLGSWTPPSGPHSYYRLQIQSTRRGGRTENASWFYFPGGFVKLLAVLRAVCVAPLYRTPCPDAFEAMLRPIHSR